MILFLFSQLAETKQTYEQYNDVIDKKIESMNHTITEKVGKLYFNYQF